MAKQVAVSVVPHAMTRLDIGTGQPFEEFVAAFEDAVSAFDLLRVKKIAQAGGTWAEVEAAATANAPHGFVLFATIDGRPLMSMAGHKRPAIEYLMGNHVIAERMFRHHPDSLLYAPLRVLIYGDDAGEAVFALDQPSTAFESLGIPEVTAVGRELDH